MITGAAGGIGFATAQRFAEEGAMVMMADRQEAALTAARERLLAAVPGARVEIFVVDVVDSEHGAEVAQRIHRSVPVIGDQEHTACRS